MIDPGVLALAIGLFFFSIMLGGVIGAYMWPIVGIRIDYGSEDMFPWIIGIDAFKATLPSFGGAAILSLVSLWIPIPLWIALLVVALFCMGQYMGTAWYLYSKGLCRMCWKRELGARYGICKDCLKGAARDRGLKLVQDDERW